MEAAIHSIGNRRWDILSSRWRGYLPDSLDQLPQSFERLSEDASIEDMMNNLTGVDQFEQIDEIPKIRTSIFEAARFQPG